MAGRKVLLIIDVQRGFIKKGMEKIVPNILSHISKEHFDLIIQSRWENYMGSRYESALGYTDVGNSAQTEMLITDYSDHVISRCQYSCVVDKLTRIIDKEDIIFVAGVDIDACVLATLYDLWDGGYTFHVFKDSVGTSGKGLTAPTLQLITRNFGKRCLL